MAGDIANSSEKNWLVKSSTRIMGPFNLDELTAMLLSKQISIIDEIRQPVGRWSYVRENQKFMDIVKNIRDEQDATSENTMTQSIAQHTFTKTENPSVLSDELTPVPIPPAPFKDVTAAERPVTKSTLASSTVSYGTAGDARLQERMRKQSTTLRWVLIGAAAVAAVAIVTMVSVKDKTQSVGYDELLAQAIRYKSLGLYEKSLQSYKRATSIKEPDLDSQIQMAPVLISEDRQSLLGRRILEQAIIQEGRNRAELVDAYLGIAVSYMMDGDLKEAENTLQKAIGHEPFNSSALLNLAIVQMKKGAYEEAMHQFERVYSKNPSSIIALFGRAMSAMEYAKVTPDRSFLKPLISDIGNSLRRANYLRQELTLFLVYAHGLLGDVDGVNQSVIKFLNERSGMSDRYTHPLNVDWRFTQWDYLEKYCNELYEKSNKTSELKALRSVCLMEVNRDGEAQKLLQEALSEGPRDPYVLAAEAGYFAKVGRFPEAMTILKMPELTTLTVRGRLMGDICIATQDVNCAQTVFTQIYDKNKSDAAALYGLAWVVMKRKDRAAAYDYVRAGLQAEPNYVPLLELRDQLESD
ncbi:MAG: tetratricopeptide repeat protein [Bdellovibrio sp.]|nr:tetratricopeptide repeat protein [Bdellovibrio sp.]